MTETNGKSNCARNSKYDYFTIRRSWILKQKRKQSNYIETKIWYSIQYQDSFNNLYGTENPELYLLRKKELKQKDSH